MGQSNIHSSNTGIFSLWMVSSKSTRNGKACAVKWKIWLTQYGFWGASLKGWRSKVSSSVISLSVSPWLEQTWPNLPSSSSSSSPLPTPSCSSACHTAGLFNLSLIPFAAQLLSYSPPTDRRSWAIRSLRVQAFTFCSWPWYLVHFGFYRKTELFRETAFSKFLVSLIRFFIICCFSSKGLSKWHPSWHPPTQNCVCCCSDCWRFYMASMVRLHQNSIDVTFVLKHMY